MLWPNDVKEELSHAFVHAVSARAGFAVEKTQKDRDSIDLHILARGQLTPQSTVDCPMIGVQLKATARALADGETFPFDLPIKNYDDLRNPRVLVPRMLVVFVMPESDELWLQSTEDALNLRHCAYWFSLYGRPEAKGDTSARVHIPRKNVLTAASLRTLMEKVSCQEELGT